MTVEEAGLGLEIKHHVRHIRLYEVPERASMGKKQAPSPRTSAAEAASAAAFTLSAP